MCIEWRLDWVSLVLTETLENRWDECWLAKAGGSVFMVLNVYLRKQSCDAEVCGLYCFMTFASTFCGGDGSSSWVDDLHVVDIKGNVDCVAFVASDI